MLHRFHCKLRWWRW